MKMPEEEPGEEPSAERIKAYTVQLWPADMQFLKTLAKERNESAGELQRRAMRVGKLIVATETSPKNGKYANQYTPAELAQELANSIVVQAIQFAERQGFPLMTMPTAFYDGLQRAITNGFADAFAKAGGIRLAETRKTLTEEESLNQQEDEKPTKPALVRASTLRRQSFRNDAKV